MNGFTRVRRRAEDSGAFSAVWVGDSLLAKPRLESIALLSALAAITKEVKLAVGCMATFPHRHPALLAQQWASLDRSEVAVPAIPVFEPVLAEAA